MRDERDVELARRFENLNDVDVPDLWDAILATAGIERAITPSREQLDLNEMGAAIMVNVDIQQSRPSRARRVRRWWPALVAAAVIVVAVVVASVRLADDHRPMSNQPGLVGSSANTLEVTENGAKLDVRGTLVAGTVSIAVRNVGDGLHSMVVGRLVDGKTLDDARNALAAAGPDVTDALAGIVEYPSPLPALSAWRGPGDASTLTVSGVASGDYVLGHVPRDNAGRPIWSQAGVQSLTIAAGDSGPGPVADATYTVRADGLDGPTRLLAGPITLAVANVSLPMTLNVYRATQNVNVVGAFFNTGGAPLDWSHAPFDFFTSTADSDAERMISLDLTPGEWIIDLRPDGQPDLAARTVIVTVA